jgi:hypothetical protein
VTYIETIAILTGILISTMIIVYTQFRISQIASSQLAGRIQDLDQALGDAISGILEGSIGDFEQQNPLVTLLTQYFASQLNPSITDVTVSRSDDGKFVKKIE